MNKIRRPKQDIRLQLGDPLPLPYKPDPVKIEEDETAVEKPFVSVKSLKLEPETRLPSRDLSLNVPTLFSRGSRSDSETEDDVSVIRLNKPRPIRRSIRSREEQKLDSIAEKINTLRTRDLTSVGLARLDDLSTRIDQLLAVEKGVEVEDNKISILDELERLQQLKKDILAPLLLQRTGHVILWLWKYWPVLAVLVVFLAVSLVFSEYNYDYCYYFC